MQTYTHFARFYDQILGDRQSIAQFVHQLIEEHHPSAETLLELGCGTGSMLQLLSEHYLVTGIDVSTDMLSIAMQKVPNAKYVLHDMTTFELSQKFDVIICVFDTINHVLNFEDWKQLFTNVKNHLNEDGLFIFDMNTNVRLKRITTAPPLIRGFNDNYVIMSGADAGDDVTNWNIKIFEHQHDRIFELFEDNVLEIAFPIDQVEEALKCHFSILAQHAEDGSPISDKTERLYFVCKINST